VDEVVIHTDGGCRGNPGPGAYAAVLRSGDHVREVVGPSQGPPTTAWNSAPPSPASRRSKGPAR
jgi:ribonuclease HI